jgi:NADPH:quinone reductase-like Zn-dependent oxidoreductase
MPFTARWAMKAIRISEHGGPEAMRLEELPTPIV